MIAGALDHDRPAAVAHREPFAGGSANERLAAARAVEARVADRRLVRLTRSAHHDEAAAHPFADAVVRLSVELKREARGEKRAEALSRAADVAVRCRRDILAARLAHHGVVGEARGDGTVGGRDVLRPAGDRCVVEVRVIDRRRVVRCAGLRQTQHFVEVDAARPVVARPHQVAAAADLVERSRAQRREAAADVARDEAQKRRGVLGGPGELSAQRCVLRRDPDRTGVQVALVGVDAAQCDQQCGPEAEHVGAEHRRYDHVATGLEAAVDAQRYPPAQPIGNQRVVGLDESQLPGQAGVLDRAQRRGPRAAVVTGDVNHVGARFGDPARDVADTRLRDQLDGDLGLRIRAAQIVDELRQILDRVDVVMRRRRDQGLACDRSTQRRDLRGHFESGDLSAFAGLRSLGDLDLEFLGGGQILGRHAEPSRRDLLDRVEGSRWVLAAFTAVAARTGELGAERDRFVRLGSERAQ